MSNRTGGTSDDVRNLIGRMAREWRGDEITKSRNSAAYMEGYRVLDWLDSQPQLPEPPWEDAPDEATHHAFDGYGIGEWLKTHKERTPAVDGAVWTGEIFDGHSRALSGCKLPLGIDWRTTLVSKPEAEQ